MDVVVSSGSPTGPMLRLKSAPDQASGQEGEADASTDPLSMPDSDLIKLLSAAASSTAGDAARTAGGDGPAPVVSQHRTGPFVALVSTLSQLLTDSLGDGLLLSKEAQVARKMNKEFDDKAAAAEAAAAAAAATDEQQPAGALVAMDGVADDAAGEEDDGAGGEKYKKPATSSEPELRARLASARSLDDLIACFLMLLAMVDTEDGVKAMTAGGWEWPEGDSKSGDTGYETYEDSVLWQLNNECHTISYLAVSAFLPFYPLSP